MESSQQLPPSSPAGEKPGVRRGIQEMCIRDRYYLDQERRQPGLNLGFAAVPVERIAPAAATLAAIIERNLTRSRQATAGQEPPVISSAHCG